MKKALIITAGIILGFYALFLLLPFVITPLASKYADDFFRDFEKDTGFRIEIVDFKIRTTPKFTAGAGFSELKIFQPDKKLLLEAKNAGVKLSLLPLFFKKIEIDKVGAKSLNLNLYVKKDGHFLIEDYLINNSSTASTKEQKPLTKEDTFGFTLSNKLPDIKIASHSVNFIAPNSKNYSLSGENTKITDFIFNKKVKFESTGKLVLDNFETFNYQAKVSNKIMPEFDINELLFGASNLETNNDKKADEFQFNIIDSFETLKKMALKGSLTSDVKIEGDINNPEVFGKVYLQNISLFQGVDKLPDSNVKIDLNKNKITIDSNIYTDKAENTKVSGSIKNGKKPSIDISCKSNATLGSIFKITRLISNVFNINDFNTLSAQGKFDIDFNIKSNLKNLISDGRIKLNNGVVSWGLYNIKIEDIVSDILLSNNSVIINKLGFSTMSIPLMISGKIDSKAVADIKLNTSNLPIKGLLLSLGQGAILKENTINSGSVTINGDLKGKLTELKISGSALLTSLSVKNLPADLLVRIPEAKADLNVTKDGYKGSAYIQNLALINPQLSVSSPKIPLLLDEKALTVNDSKVFVGDNVLTVTGSISNYLTDKILLDFKTSGKINSKLEGNINPYKLISDLKFSIPSVSEIIIPGFSKSKLNIRGNLDIKGSLLNPVLSGSFDIPSVKIPEIPVEVSNMKLNLDGTILNGNFKLSNFKSGGIMGENISSDFKLIGNDFFLNNLQGNAFDGKFNGQIVYNLSNTNCKVKFKGDNMNALKAIEGAAGIKNALEGNLNFNADVAFKGIEYDDMINSLTGNTQFEITNGTLLNLGSLKSLLNAQNILSNAILNGSLRALKSLPVVEQSSEFDYIKGNLSFKNAYANLSPVNLSGPLMAYNIKGKFNLLNGSTNVVVLGRLSQEIVGALGAFGEFSVGKLTKLIPGLGNLTSQIASRMVESPNDTDLNSIPKLRSQSKNNQAFKVLFNGGVDSTSSVKSFKWLTKLDTTAIDSNNGVNQNSLNEQVKQIKSTVNDVKNKINADSQAKKEEIKHSVENTKNQIQQVKSDFTQTKELFKSILKTQ